VAQHASPTVGLHALWSNTGASTRHAICVTVKQHDPQESRRVDAKRQRNASGLRCDVDTAV
jgi:hypothetical protein